MGPMYIETPYIFDLVYRDILYKICLAIAEVIYISVGFSDAFIFQ